MGLIVTNAEYLDEPPLGAALTAYDQAHLKLYLRLLDAEADGALQRNTPLGVPHKKHAESALHQLGCGHAHHCRSPAGGTPPGA